MGFVFNRICGPCGTKREEEEEEEDVQYFDGHIKGKDNDWTTHTKVLGGY